MSEGIQSFLSIRRMDARTRPRPSIIRPIRARPSANPVMFNGNARARVETGPL